MTAKFRTQFRQRCRESRMSMTRRRKRRSHTWNTGGGGSQEPTEGAKGRSSQLTFDSELHFLWICTNPTLKVTISRCYPFALGERRRDICYLQDSKKWSICLLGWESLLSIIFWFPHFHQYFIVLYLNKIPLCIPVSFLLVCRHLGCFPVLTIVNRAAKHMGHKEK